MARPLRPLVPDGVYHVTARGNGSAPIYLDDRDRASFLALVDRSVRRFDWRCLTYCLMGNHFHLLLRTPQPNLSRGMQSLQSAYAQTFNRRHERVGHLFAARFSAVLVQRDSHLLEVFRYIALNPVRAGLCPEPSAWAWSGHRALADAADAPPWHAADEALAYFAGAADRNGATAYGAFVASEREADYPPQGVVYGTPDFKRAVLPATRPAAEIPQRDWGEGRPSLDALLHGSTTGASIALAYRTYGYALPEIAAYIDRHVSTVSRRLAAYEQRSGECVL